MDEELALRLHEKEKAELERMQGDRSAQEEASNAALTAKFDNVQARIDAYALEQKWINDFVPMDSEVIKYSRKKDDSSQKQDVLDLYRLVKQRNETISPEGYDILLWVDLITVFEPSKEDEIWKVQQDYNLISWSLFNSCGVHILLMDTGIAIL
nr:hypothetical protein [Tanacetum cinerariifolium]